MGQDPPFCIFPSDWGSGFLSFSFKAHSPASLVSLQQMVLFGQNPSQGTLLKASQFLSGKPISFLSPKINLTCIEELPVRLAHRVKELDELPHNLSAMPSINKVKNWYAQSFEVCPFPQPIHLFMNIPTGTHYFPSHCLTPQYPSSTHGIPFR